MAFEAVLQERFRCFRRVALAPVEPGKAPADLERSIGKEWLQVGQGEAAEADRLVRLPDGGGIKSESGLLDPAGDPVHQRIGLGAGAAERKKRHHLGIGIDPGEERPVAVSPVAQTEAPCFKNGGHCEPGLAKSVLR